MNWIDIIDDESLFAIWYALSRRNVMAVNGIIQRNCRGYSQLREWLHTILASIAVLSPWTSKM